jgi:hypothetical protein
MKRRMKANYTILFVLITSGVFAKKKYALSGVVNDSLQNNIQDGIVLLFSRGDSALLKTTFIENGKFELVDLNSGKYLLKISCLGFQDKLNEISIPEDKNLQLVLVKSTTLLKEVQISGYRKLIEFKNGNLISTIENTVLATLPDIFEVLSKLPTIQVSNDRENITVIGKGTPIIYLDNQRITLNELSTLAVNDVKSIELINNPSAKYDADGRVVLLVKRKVNPQNGYKIDFSETASQKRYFENRAGVNACIKRNKLEVKLNVQYNYINRWEGLEGIITTDTGMYKSSFNGTSIGPRKQYLFGAGLFYQINNTDYFSVNLSTRIQEEPFNTQTLSDETKTLGYTQVNNKVKGLSSRPFYNTNFNYLKEFTKHQTQLFIGGQWAHYERNLENQIANNPNNTGFLDTENRLQASSINIGVLRTDLDKKIKQHTLSGGLLYTQANATTQFDIDYPQISAKFKTTYLYTEYNQAAYTQLKGTLKKWEYQIGLRFEATDLKGQYADSNILLVNRNFTNLFPKANFTFPLDSFSNLTISYNRSIRRPDYSNANQVTNYITPFLEFSNNININPVLTDEVNINYTRKKISLTLNLYSRQNPAYHITKYDSELDKLRIINVNLQSEKGGILTLTVPYEYKKWSTTNTSSILYNRIDDAVAYFSKAIPYLYFYSNNQFRLPKSYILSLNGWLQTKRYEGIFERNMQFAVDVSLSKTFHKRFTVSMNAFDIFRSLNYIESYKVNGIYARTTYFENVREFSISLRYTIGKTQKLQFKNREVNEGSRIN